MPQYVIIAYDDTDAGALDRRMEAREAHIKCLDALRKAGNALIGVALTDDSGKMIGSVIVTDFPNRVALDNWLATEPYVVQRVWKKIDVHNGKLGPSFTDLAKAG